jgi:hypothetical protein
MRGEDLVLKNPSYHFPNNWERVVLYIKTSQPRVFIVILPTFSLEKKEKGPLLLFLKKLLVKKI